MMSEKRFRKVANPATDKWDIIDEKASEKINGLVIYNDLGSLYFSSVPQICDLLNDLNDENERLRKIGVMYQGHNPCSTCTYCLEGELCCAEPIPILCDHAKEDFIQGLCKKHKQFVKSIRRYDDE